jgi:hypothetical protein
LLRLRPVAGDRVLIIDGLFLQAAPVRHKEILLLLDQQVTVAGSSSMGALRAAELWPYGMRGVGEVFRLYRDLVVTGDDEVAVIHCSAEEEYRALSEPLVNIRIALRDACAAGAISADEETRFLATARAVPFRSRSFRMLDRLIRDDLGADPADRFAAWHGAHARDAKADDARLLLRMAAAGDPALRPADPGDEPIRHPRTHHTEAWSLKFRGVTRGAEWVTDTDVTTAIMLLHPEFPGRHRLDVLADVGGTTWDDPRATELALAKAHSRGVGEHSAAMPDGWLTPADRHGVPATEQLARLLVRAFGTANNQGISLAARGSLLADDAVREWGRQVARAAHQCNLLIPSGPQDRQHFRDEVVDQAFVREWQCGPGERGAAIWDRGIGGLPEFRRIAEPFVCYLKTGVRIASPPPGVLFKTTGAGVSRRGSSSGLARMSSPATVIAARGLVASASRPPSALKMAIDACWPIDQADSVRAMPRSGVCSSR